MRKQFRLNITESQIQYSCLTTARRSFILNKLHFINWISTGLNFDSKWNAVDTPLTSFHFYFESIVTNITPFIYSKPQASSQPLQQSGFLS